MFLVVESNELAMFLSTFSNRKNVFDRIFEIEGIGDVLGQDFERICDIFGQNFQIKRRFLIEIFKSIELAMLLVVKSSEFALFSTKTSNELAMSLSEFSNRTNVFDRNFEIGGFGDVFGREIERICTVLGQYFARIGDVFRLNFVKSNEPLPNDFRECSLLAE